MLDPALLLCQDCTAWRLCTNLTNQEADFRPSSDQFVCATVVSKHSRSCDQYTY